MNIEPMPDVDDLAEDAMRIQHVLRLVHENGPRLSAGALSVIGLCADLCGDLGRKIDKLPRHD